MYPEEFVKPMRQDLAQAGFQELFTAAAVAEAVNASGTTLVVVNSVCGCAAANARPAAKMSLTNAKVPSRAVTVFAGVDTDAV
ncbi:MAG TPA: BrxA/BrxB family bacilliredoxin, partial [Flavobacteriaceae bacterium]|nr:BrxA/BrxB family bacilliredoxin [Flavobacteriaceae bacterium]